MDVLVINQFFWPDTAATGQLLTDVTRGMDPKVHAVTVLCGTPDYGASRYGLPAASEDSAVGRDGFFKR